MTGSTDWNVNSVAFRPPSPPSNLICGSQVPKSRAPAFPVTAVALLAAALVVALALTAFPALALLFVALVAVEALDLVTVARVVATAAGPHAP